MDLHERLVNVNKAAKAILEAGTFILIPISEDFNLVATNHFILRLNDKQFWKVQCKIEAKQHEVWLYKTKDGLEEAQGPLTAEDVRSKYFAIMNHGTVGVLASTRLNLDEYIRLYVDNTRYYGIHAKYFEMLSGGYPAIKKLASKEFLLVDDIHLICPVDLGEKKCEFLKEVALC